jgi:prophage tail gpP-like protein
MSETMTIISNKTKVAYKINHIKSYKIETSIDIPADSFEIIIGNFNYEVSDCISAGDKIKFYIDGDLALEGYIDDIDLEYSMESNDIRITGRDEISTLLDNDAKSKTYNKIGLKDYLKKILPSYNIEYSCSSNSKFNKVTVSPGETEYNVIERLAKDRNLTPVYNIFESKLELVKPVSTKNCTYYFNNKSNYGIKMSDCQITISNDIKNEVIVYGGDYEKNKNIKGTYIDSNLKTKKRRILNESDIEKSSDAKKRAKEEFYNINKNALTVQITTYTKKPIYINKSARVKIPKMEFDAYLLIDSVSYTKNNESGSITNITLKLMPGIKVSFKNNDIPLLPEL